MLFDPVEAFKAVLSEAKAKFVESVDTSINLSFGGNKKLGGVVRGSMVLPNTTGRKVRVAVFAEGEAAKAASDAGADCVDFTELSDDLSKGVVNYDIYIATPDMMKGISKFARVLGPKGLMPSIKSGTVTDDLSAVIKDVKSGHKIEYKSDRNGVINLKIGNVEQTVESLMDNLKSVVKHICSNKPEGITKMSVKSVHLSSTMGKSKGVNVSLMLNK